MIGKFLKWLDGGSWPATIIAALISAAMIVTPVAIWWFR